MHVSPDNNRPGQASGLGAGQSAQQSQPPVAGRQAAQSAQAADKMHQAKKQFKGYLTLLFQDLCTKESGLSKPYIRFYTFLKYSRLPSLMARRLFELMANDVGMKMSSQADSYNNDEGNLDPSQLEKVVERQRFTQILLDLYFGQIELKMDLIFRVLDIKGDGYLDYQCIRIFLIHTITIQRTKQFPFIEELFSTFPHSSLECFKLLSNHQMQNYHESIAQPTMREAIIDRILITDLFHSHQPSSGIAHQIQGERKIDLEEYNRKKPLIFNLIFEQVQLFMPCSEQYFKSMGEYAQPLKAYSQAQQRPNFTGGVGRVVVNAGGAAGNSESEIYKKLSQYSKVFNDQSGPNCEGSATQERERNTAGRSVVFKQGRQDAGGQQAGLFQFGRNRVPSHLPQYAMAAAEGSAGGIGPLPQGRSVSPEGSNAAILANHTQINKGLAQPDHSKSLDRASVGNPQFCFGHGGKAAVSHNLAGSDPFNVARVQPVIGARHSEVPHNPIQIHHFGIGDPNQPIFENPANEEQSDRNHYQNVKQSNEDQDRQQQLESQQKMVRELKESLKDTVKEGEIGQDGGEFGQQNTRTRLVKNQPIISCLHSNYEAMKRKANDALETLKIPLQRPKRNFLEHSRLVSQSRFESIMTHSVASRIEISRMQMKVNINNHQNMESHLVYSNSVMGMMPAGVGGQANRTPGAQIQVNQSSNVNFNNNIGAAHNQGQAFGLSGQQFVPGYREEMKEPILQLSCEQSQPGISGGNLQGLRVQQKPMEGWVFFKFSAKTNALDRYYISIQSSDFYCYENEQKKKPKFMHSLVGCFPVEQPDNIMALMKEQPLSLPAPYEEVEGQKYWRVELKLSQIYKRVFFLKTKEERDVWIRRLNQAAKLRHIHEEYDLTDQVLGQGSYGRVVKAKSRASGQLVAVKQINKKGLQSEEIVLQMNEIDILRASSHTYIVKLIDFFEDAKFFSIVLEYLEGKDLFGHLESRVADEEHIRTMVRQLSEGMDYIHNQLGVMHRDIKMENIIVVADHVDGDPFLPQGVTQQVTAKIIDFGLALVMMPHEKCHQAYGTLAYCSPEIIHNYPHTNCTDVWSFGIVLHVMLTLKIPFLAHHKRITSKNIVSQQLTFEEEIWHFVSENAKRLVDRMLDKSAETRITMKEVLEHPWFKETLVSKRKAIV